MQSIAFYAHLDNTEGIALRAADGTVHFQVDATGLWTPLTDADAPRLHLHGRTDLALTQRLVDGNLVVKASRTVMEVA